MALDIHKLENGKAGELLFQINDSMYNLLEPAFQLFKQRTGLFIDPYGDLKFSSGLSGLIGAVSDSSGKIELIEQKNYNEFLILLEGLERNKAHVVFLGD